MDSTSVSYASNTEVSGLTSMLKSKIAASLNMFAGFSIKTSPDREMDTHDNRQQRAQDFLAGQSNEFKGELLEAKNIKDFIKKLHESQHRNRQNTLIMSDKEKVGGVTLLRQNIAIGIFYDKDELDGHRWVNIYPKLKTKIVAALNLFGSLVDQSSTDTQTDQSMDLDTPPGRQKRVEAFLNFQSMQSYWIFPFVKGLYDMGNLNEFMTEVLHALEQPEHPLTLTPLEREGLLSIDCREFGHYKYDANQQTWYDSSAQIQSESDV